MFKKAAHLIYNINIKNMLRGFTVIQKSVFLVVLLPFLFSTGCSKKVPFVTAPHIDENSKGSIVINKDAKPYPYYLHLPEDFDKHDYTYPLLIFFHGSDCLSSKLNTDPLKYGPLKQLYNENSSNINMDNLKSLNLYVKSSFVLVPQATVSARWRESIDSMIDGLLQEYPIDESRIYLTGLSIGGGATWDYAEQGFDRYAAIVPICGSSSFPGKQVLKDMRIWAFHAFDDKTTPIDATTNPILNTVLSVNNVMENYPHIDDDVTKAAVSDFIISFGKGGDSKWRENISEANGSVNYTLYKTGGHNIWSRVYGDESMWRWLYSQTK